MPNPNRIEKADIFLRAFVIATGLKLLISPWATGDYISSWGIMLNYACDGILMGIVVLQLNRFPKVYLPLVWITALTALAYVVSTFLYTSESMVSALINHIRFFLPLLAIPALISLVTRSGINFNRTAYAISLMVLGCIIIGILFFPPSMNRVEQWLPTYFGGLHTTAYVALLTMFLVHAIWQHRLIPAYRATAIILFIIGMIFFGWGVRTASIAIVIFFAGLISSRWSFMNRPIVPLLLPIGLTLTIGLLPLLDFSGEVDELSSGRISMYIAKYTQVGKNTLLQWFIGNGYKSDLIVTDVWWWEAKGAHSDIITFLVEGGLIYLGGFIAAITYLFKIHNTLQERLILMAILSTSIFSNGVIARPIAAYMLSFVFAIYCYNASNQKHNAE